VASPRSQARRASAARGALSAASMAADQAAIPGRYSIIAPTYNEAENVPLLVALVAEACSGADLDWELVVVDDGSPDGTADVSERLGLGQRRRGA
jgi:dolichol-phosphate mannosyltransferase